MTELLEYPLRWNDLHQLQADVRGALGGGAAEVHGAEPVPVGTLCTLALVHPVTGEVLTLPGEVVASMSGQTRVQLLDRDGRLRARLHAFAGGPPPSNEALPPEADEPSDGESPLDQSAVAIQERIRALSPNDRRKLAATGGQTERQVLERTFGKDVWDSLLGNPRITQPEVARIARMGSLPTPLVVRITDNVAWLSSPQVRRALLSNPRLGGTALQKVLSATPRSELKLMVQQTAYPAVVREAARKLVMRGG